MKCNIGQKNICSISENGYYGNSYYMYIIADK